MTDPLLLDLPPSIETERLILRPPEAGDGPTFHAAVTESVGELRQFLGSLPWIAGEQTAESAEIYCRNAHANFVARKDLSLFVFDKVSDDLIGGVGLHRTVWATPKTEVGYWCRTSKLGKGYVSEAVGILTRFALEQLGMARVELITDEANHASRRVADRCGFALEGILRHESRAPDGTLRDTCVYARLATTP